MQNNGTESPATPIIGRAMKKTEKEQPGKEQSTPTPDSTGKPATLSTPVSTGNPATTQQKHLNISPPSSAASKHSTSGAANYKNLENLSPNPSNDSSSTDISALTSPSLSSEDMQSLGQSSKHPVPFVSASPRAESGRL